MRRTIGLLVLGLGVGAFSAAPAAAAPESFLYRSSPRVDISLFYDDLAPRGDWIEYQDYGWAWSPRVDAGWRPYTVGHWVWTDEYGWLWASDEDFGWATYHYGRWIDDPDQGWLWIPGSEWGPAWVSWRSGDDYIGWAPLPPRFRWNAGVGFEIRGEEIDEFIPAREYCFVESRRFADRAVYRHLLPESRARVYVHITNNVTDYRFLGGRIVNRGVDLDRVERFTGHAVPRVHAVDVSSVRDVHRHDVGRGEVAVFRPAVDPRADRLPPRAREDAARMGRGQQIHERERQDLERQQAQERAQLEREHQQEWRSAAREMGGRTVRTDQEREREQQRLDRAQAQERDQAERRHQQELQRAERQRAYSDELARRQTEQHQLLEKQQEDARRQREQQLQAQAQQQAQTRAQEIARAQEEQHRALAERQAHERQDMEAQREQARQQARAHAAEHPPARSDSHPREQKHDDKHPDKDHEKAHRRGE